MRVLCVFALVFAAASCGGGGHAQRRDPAVASQAPARGRRGRERASASASASPSPSASATPDRSDAPALETIEGRVSFYADSLAGHRTASGESYDPAALTCASRDLPFGSLLRVVRIDTGASVIVRVNDRGPWGRRTRILDLSRAAAEALAMIRAGVVTVRAEVIRRGE